jgi:hypothetical protein
MFDRFRATWQLLKTGTAVKPKSPLESAVQYARSVLDDKSQGLGKEWSKEGKEKLLSDLISDIRNVLATPNPVQAVQMRMIEFALMTAKFDVLVMQNPTSFRGVSGELKSHISALASVDDELRQLFSDTAASSEEQMWDAVLARYWVMHLYMSTYNIIRINLHDHPDDPARDWLKPCYRSLCAWQEYNYREDLSLPTILEGNNADIKHLAYFGWIRLAEEGHKDLLTEWEKLWVSTCHEPSSYS